MRREDVPERLAAVPCPDLGDPAGTGGGPIVERKVCCISTAGLMHRGDRPFTLNSADYRIIDAADLRPLMMSHISTNFDRSGFAGDVNVVFPIDILRDMAVSGEIGELSTFHYSFMGATDPSAMLPAAQQLASLLLADGVDLALLVPV